MSFGTDDSILATRSDEALALVLLENIEDRNLDICKKTGGKVQSVARGSDAPNEYKSDIQPKWTKSKNDGTTRNPNKTASNYKWGNEGITRFNHLMGFVSKDRKSHPGFLEKFVALEKSKMYGTAKAKIDVVRDPEVEIEAKNDLFDDDNNDQVTTKTIKTKKTPGTASDEASNNAENDDNEETDLEDDPIQENKETDESYDEKDNDDDNNDNDEDESKDKEEKEEEENEED